MKRTEPLTRKKRPTRDDARRALEFSRCYGSHARVLAIKALPCAACGVWPSPYGQSHNAHCPPRHNKDRGMGRKAGWEWVVPLCADCHRKRDEVYGANDRFEEATGVDLTAKAKQTAQTVGKDGTRYDLDF